MCNSVYYYDSILNLLCVFKGYCANCIVPNFKKFGKSLTYLMSD